jgi:hypothetical protein
MAGEPLATGTWAADKTAKNVDFPPTEARYIRLKALSEISGGEGASAAKIDLVGVLAE